LNAARLNRGPSRGEVLKTTQALLHLVEQLGWIVNIEKSDRNIFELFTQSGAQSRDNNGLQYIGALSSKLVLCNETSGWLQRNIRD
jgi:hypothetical protein